MDQASHEALLFAVGPRNEEGRINAARHSERLARDHKRRCINKHEIRRLLKFRDRRGNTFGAEPLHDPSWRIACRENKEPVLSLMNHIADSRIAYQNFPDALASKGAAPIQMPATAEKVWRSLNAA